MDKPNVVIFSGTFQDEPNKEAYFLKPHLISSLSDEKIVRVATGCVAQHSFFISEDGRVWGVGRNGNGQLGIKTQPFVKAPTLITSLSEFKIAKAACGRHHSIFVTQDGKILSCGLNKAGQLARVPKNGDPELIPAFNGVEIKEIACGGDFSVALDSTGRLWSWGSPEYGQLGSGSDHMTVGAGKHNYNAQPPHKIGGLLATVKITKMACGTNHTLAIDEAGEVYTWGFGGYGRLGHKVQKDEFKPKKIDQKLFSPATDVAAGSQYSMAVGQFDVLYTFGKVKNSENRMYPIAEKDLAGWKTDSISCGNTTFAVTSQTFLQTAGWGTCPHGELGFGEEQKSSARPKLIEDFNDVKILQVACSAYHTIYLAVPSEKTDAMPTYAPIQDDAEVEADPEEEGDEDSEESSVETSSSGEDKTKKPVKKTGAKGTKRAGAAKEKKAPVKKAKK